MTKICLDGVAIRFVKYVGYSYAIFELGRVDCIELEALKKAYTRPAPPMNGDLTNGTIQKSEDSCRRLYSVRLCLFVGNICNGKDLIEDTNDRANVVITCVSGNIRPTLKSIEHNTWRDRLGNWFERFPVDWDQCMKGEEETAMSEETLKVKEVQLRQVAIRVDSSTGRGTTKITIGRLSTNEYNGIKNMVEAYGTGEYRNTWTGRERGGLSNPLHEISFWVHNSVELKNIDIASARIVPNCQSLAVEITDVYDWGGDALGSLREPNWFGSETKTVFEARGAVICNHGSSGMQIARLDVTERTRFDSFAGEYGSALNGQFDRLLTEGSIFLDNDRVLKNVSFADGIEFKAGESICTDYIKIERTGNKFKIVEAKRCTEENVEERWHLASTETPEDRRVTFSNVAVKVARKVGSLDYYILEIGRLTVEELTSLKKVYRHVGDFNTETHEMDETKGKVLSREIRVTDDDGETWDYYVAKVCVFWPKYFGGSDDMVGKIIDSADITLESHHGNFRPTLESIEEHEEIHNQYSGRWFERFPFEAKDDDPIKIRLNGVFAVNITRECDYRGIKAIVQFSLIQCCNYHQAVEDIGKALAIREGESSRGISWNPSRKLLEVPIQDDISRIEDARSRLRMLELQYNPDSGAWGINEMHEFPYHGGFVYANPSRRNGKTAELRRMLNASYGIYGDAMRYCAHDVAIQEAMWRRAQAILTGKKSEEEETMRFGVPKIKQLIFDDPTTVVIWDDGTKTIVHARDEKFDPEKGLAMAIARKALGNDREYYTYMQRQIKKGLRDSEGRKKKNEKPAAKKKTPAKKPATAPKKKGGKK